jgi:hypothetical protein
MIPPRGAGADDLGDSLISEVRRIRESISGQYGNDVDRLCDHLVTVAQDFAARRGVFAGISPAAAAAVIESWGEDVYRRDDPITDEVREIRRKRWEGYSLDNPPPGVKP